MKVCLGCNQNKTNASFHKAPGNIGGRHCHCKVCKAVIDRDKRIKITARIFETYGQTCKGCQKRFPTYILEFHHRVPADKVFTVLGGIGRKWESLVEEIKKCDLLCANCHREAHEIMRREADEKDSGSVDVIIADDVPPSSSPGESVQLGLDLEAGGIRIYPFGEFKVNRNS